LNEARVIGSPVARFRGKIDPATHIGIPEISGLAMRRFKDSLENAVVGDVFYLTFGISALEPVAGNEDQVQYTDKVIKNTRDILFGKYMSSGSETDEEADTLSKSSSSMAQAQRLVKIGMDRISEIQKVRIEVLKNALEEIRKQNSSFDSVSALLKIIQLASSDVRALRVAGDDASNKVRRNMVNEVKKALYGGTIKLQPDVLESERQLIESAQLIAYGDMIRDMSVDQTDIPGTQKLTAGGNKTGVSKVVGNSESILMAIAGLKRKSQNLREKELVPDKELQETLAVNVKQMTADILIGSCASLLTFEGTKLQITSGKAHRLLEQSELPLPVLMSTLEILLSDINYGRAFRSPTGYLTKSLFLPGDNQTGSRDPLHSFSFISWGQHLDPAHTIKIALGFIGQENLAYDNDRGVRSQRAGDRDKNYWDDSVRKITDSRDGMKIIKELEDAAFKVEGSRASAKVTAADVAAIAGIIQSEDLPQTEKIITGLLRSREAKRNAAHLPHPGSESEGRRLQSEQDYGFQRGGAKSSSQVAESIAKLASGEASERHIYEKIMRNILYGTTLVCVGKGIETSLGEDALTKKIDTVLTKDAEAPFLKRQFPIFAAKMEVPKQYRTRSIEDLSTRGRLVSDRPAELSPFTKQQGDPRETGKVASAGEQTSYRRQDSLRAEIHTPNLRLTVTDDALMRALSAGTVNELISNRENYALGNPLRIPFIEKKTIIRTKMTLEDVLGLERFYDSNLKAVNVPIQLMGAKKIHDPSLTTKTVTQAHIRVIPEMGILPLGYIAEQTAIAPDRRMSLVAGMRDNTARAINRLSPDISGRPESVESFDLTNRVVEPGWKSSDLKSSVEEAIMQLREDAMSFGISPMFTHMNLLANGLLRDLKSSHSADDASFQTRINARLATYFLASIQSEAHKIVNQEMPFLSSFATIEPTLRNTMTGRSEQDGSIDATSIAALTAIKRGLEAEAYGRDLKQVPAMSYITLSGLRRDASSINSINDAIVSLAQKDVNRGDPASLSQGMSVYPLLALHENAKASGASLLESLDKMKITQLLAVLRKESTARDAGDVTGLDEDTDLKDAYEETIDWAESLKSHLASTDNFAVLRTKMDKFEGDLLKSPFTSSLNSLPFFLASVTPAMLNNDTGDEAIADVMDKASLVGDELRSDFAARFKKLYSFSSEFMSACTKQRSLSMDLVGLAASLNGLAASIVTRAQKLSEDESSSEEKSRLASIIERANETVSLTNESLDSAKTYDSLVKTGQVKFNPDILFKLTQVKKSNFGEIATGLLKIFSALSAEIESGRMKSSLDDVRSLKQEKFEISPSAVEADFDKASKTAPMTRDQLALLRAVLSGGVNSLDLTKSVKPYDIAMRIVRSDETPENIRDLALTTFFPGVSVGMLKDLTSKGQERNLEHLSNGVWLRSRSRKINDAVKRATAARATLQQTESIKRKDDVTAQLDRIYGYLSARGKTRPLVPAVRVDQTTFDPSRTVTVKSGPTRGDSAAVATRPRPRASDPALGDSAAVSARSRHLVSSAKFQADLAAKIESNRTPAAIQSRGDSDVVIGDIATYTSAADKIKRVISDGGSGAGVVGQDGDPISDMTIQDAIDSLSKGELTKSGEAITDFAAREIQSALLDAKSVIDALVSKLPDSASMLNPSLENASGTINRLLRRLMPKTTTA
jgi:hypothetical protein